ncbi:MAG: hypothetical protein VB078_10200 [Clostridiaceae bacterium]|nr:hypothetical protein [Clostridiaceae bacterium]
MSEQDDTNIAAESTAPDIGKALSMASEIFAASKGAVPSSNPAKTEATHAEANNGNPPSNEELAAMLAQLLASKGSQGQTTAPQDEASSAAASSETSAGSGLSGIAAMLPTLMQAMSGNGNFIKPEKLNLIKALKPYMSDTRGGSIDRAIKMANIAQAAKSALTVLGR